MTSTFKKAAAKVGQIARSVKSIEYIDDVRTLLFAKNAVESGYHKEIEKELKDAIRPGIKFGLLVLLVSFLFFIVWGGLAPLDSAAIAEGLVVLSGSHKTIQHLEGGVVEKINVEDGQEVNEGDVLMELNDTAAKARLQITESQKILSQAIEVRLNAEQKGLDELVFPEEKFNFANPEVTKSVETQISLFQVRRSVVKGKIDVLNEKIHQYQEEIIGLDARLVSSLSQQLSLKEELKSTEDLFAKGLALKPRLYELRRRNDEVVATVSEVKSRIASSKQTIAEARLEILNAENQFQSQVAEEYKENHSHLLELAEQENAARDVLTRTKIKSPVTGVVTDLQFHTIGGVIPQGQKIMDIVPANDKLIVEAKVLTKDIDSIHIGLVTKIQLGAYKAKLVPRLDGKVIYIAADKLIDQQRGTHYYVVRIEVDPKQIANLTYEIKLAPGMPATVFIVKGERTFLQYLISPIRDSFYRAFKEQ